MKFYKTRGGEEITAFEAGGRVVIAGLAGAFVAGTPLGAVLGVFTWIASRKDPEMKKQLRRICDDVADAVDVLVTCARGGPPGWTSRDSAAGFNAKAARRGDSPKPRPPAPQGPGPG